MRPVFAFALVAAVAGAAWFYLRRADASGAGVDAPDPSGDWGPVQLLADAADAIEGAVMTQQTLSDSGLSTLQGLEGFSATPYPDFKGNSIGYGHLIKPGEVFASVTRDEAAELLRSDVAWAERAVRACVAVPLDQNQFDALVCFAFNIGAAAFASSTLVRKLNAGDVDGAADEFARWNRAGGVVNPTLVARRETERNLFEA